jgi:hypothetical protein
MAQTTQNTPATWRRATWVARGGRNGATTLLLLIVESLRDILNIKYPDCVYWLRQSEI